MSFDSIYKKIKTSFEKTTGHTVYPDSDLGIRMKIFAGELASLESQIAESEKQMFPQTATGVFLARHGQCRDIAKKEAMAAVGVLRFSRSTPASNAIIIPAGTLCTSSSGGGMMYATTTEGMIAKNETSCDIPAVAQEIGLDGNILAKKIDTLVSTLAGVEKVENPANFSGGRPAESDESFRARLLDSYINVSNGTNLKFYQDFALRHPVVTSAKAVMETSGNQLTLYVTDFFRTISQSVIQELQAQLEEIRDLNLKVVVKAATPVVTDITLKILMRSLQNPGLNTNNITENLRTKIYNLAVGEDVNPYALGAGLKEEVQEAVSVIFVNPNNIRTIAPSSVASPNKIDLIFERV